MVAARITWMSLDVARNCGSSEDGSGNSTRLMQSFSLLLATLLVTLLARVPMHECQGPRTKDDTWRQEPAVPTLRTQCFIQDVVPQVCLI